MRAFRPDGVDRYCGEARKGRQQFGGESLIAIALQDVAQLARLHGVDRRADLLGNGGIAGLVNRQSNDAAGFGSRHGETSAVRIVPIVGGLKAGALGHTSIFVEVWILAGSAFLLISTTIKNIGESSSSTYGHTKRRGSDARSSCAAKVSVCWFLSTHEEMPINRGFLGGLLPMVRRPDARGKHESEKVATCL